MIAAYKAEGLDVHVDLRLDTFARLHITVPTEPDHRYCVELVANWRATPSTDGHRPGSAPRRRHGRQDGRPVQPAAARDFPDIDAAITSGRYSLDRLCRLAQDADAGFDRHLFATMLSHIDRLDDEDFIVYGVSTDHVAALRRRVTARQHRLTE